MGNKVREKQYPSNEFIVVKSHKYKKKTGVSSFVIKTFNKFEGLKEEECTLEEFKVYKNSMVVNSKNDRIKPKESCTSDEIREVKSKRDKKRTGVTSNMIKTCNVFEALDETECMVEEYTVKISKNNFAEKFKKEENDTIKSKTQFEQNIRCDQNLKFFVTQNRFALLEDIINEDLIRKRNLKKCRKCNNKKRSCYLDSFSCQASEKNCFRCNKKGHFPQSSNCKTKRKSGRSKVKKGKDQMSKKLTKTNLKLIKRHILYLERQLALKFEISCLKNQVKGEIAKEQPELSTNNRKLSVKESLMKTADFCANKFETTDPIESKEYFMRYCITRANQIIPEETLPSIEEEVLIKEKLDVFQKMFYNEDVPYNEDQDPGILITQLDGANDSESSQDEDIIVKSVFGINCEVNEIIQLVNSSSHCKCEFNQKQYEQNCFFCLIEQKDLEA